MLKFIVFIVVAFVLVDVQWSHAKSKRLADRQGVSTVSQPGANPPAERPRDPADIALDKKIKSICRGC
ncbi:hypothetical protein MA20_03175 [Bradyrhizobium japonicum]|uniref:Uncharacterized protein n=1 Tax=Bradyrhizobium japonicum TaxID=375 RepID=A0A0A3Y849_BRAJP|nr:hypothetical protein MA20_03175 [Bradyrhizobium japonicum]MCS3978777.1 hypothetical protein [Bradyrhizobium japonicum]